MCTLLVRTLSNCIGYCSFHTGDLNDRKLQPLTNAPITNVWLHQTTIYSHARVVLSRSTDDVYTLEARTWVFSRTDMLQLPLTQLWRQQLSSADWYCWYWGVLMLLSTVGFVLRLVLFESDMYYFQGLISLGIRLERGS